MSVEDRSWIYNGWDDNGCHFEEWVRNTNAFLDHAFQGVSNADKFGVVCPCWNCRNRIRRRDVMTMHLCQRRYMPRYTRWTKHGEHPIRSSTLNGNYNTADRLDDFLADIDDAMQTDIIEDEPMYEESFSPNPSPAAEAHANSSTVGADNQDDLLERVAQGMFGGYADRSGSDIRNMTSNMDDNLVF